MATLRDKEIPADNKNQDNGFYWSKDVKEAVLELEEKLIDKLVINKTFKYQSDMEDILFKIQDTIKEIFGDFKK